MDFVQRAKALIKSSAKSGALKILPLAAAAALSMGSGQAAATFETGSAFSFCPNGSLTLSNTADVAGVTGLKIANSSGGFCSDSGSGIASLIAGASGGGSGSFDPTLTQLAVTFDFTGYATEGGNAVDFAWEMTVQINTSAGSVFGNGGPDGGPSGSAVNSSLSGPILIDMTPVQGADFQSWSVLLALTAESIEDPEAAMTVGVQIPNNSIDINGVQTNVDDVPEPGTLALMFVGGVAYLVRRRMTS